MSNEMPTPYPSNERFQTPANPKSKHALSKVEQLNRTLQQLKAVDAQNPKIDELRKQFERGDQLGKQAEPFFEAALSEVGKNFRYTIHRAPESLDYFHPHVDHIMLLPDGNIIGIQMYSPSNQYDTKGMAGEMIKKYEPVIRWGIRPLPGFPEKTFGQAPIGFVTPQLNRDTIGQISLWEPGQPIENTKKLASDFFNLLARSVDPDVRERFLKVSLLDPKSKIPKTLAGQALLDIGRQRTILSNYSRSLETLSRRLQT